MKRFLAAAVLPFVSVTMWAQSNANPLTAGEKMVYTMTRNNVMKAAQEVPEELYLFKPTEDVRTFGQLVAHVADAQYEFCGPVMGDKEKAPDVEKNTTGKAALIEALKASYAYCDKAFAGMTDDSGKEIVKFFGHNTPKLTLLSFNTAHTDEHYGNMVTYMRLKKLVPPSSMQQPPPAAKPETTPGK
jgi:uncharacterized damage-inducible protein DinB